MMKRITLSLVYSLSTFTLLLLSFIGNAQVIDITNTNNPSSAFDPISLISNTFFSAGIQVDTIIYTGNAEQVGFFSNGTVAVGMDNGIILSSGNADDGIGPNALGSTTTEYNTSGGSPELAAIATSSINDLCQYEIIFTPEASVLTFEYVFASEEYEEFVGSTFNDVFGFFLSSPGAVGPYSNIALIPGTPTPVSINNVNQNTNTTYYNSNPPNSPNLEYDGYTTVLTATANVIPCQQYSIKLAISDVGDDSWDSSVFLKAGSFTTNAIATTPLTPSPDTILIEGCSDGGIEFNLSAPADAPVTVNYTIGGTATMGVDYQTIPTSGIIPTGGTQFSFPIIPILDNVTEGTEYIELIVNTTPCTLDTVRIYIKDNDLILNPISDAILCPGDNLTLDVTSPTPIPPAFSFSNTASQSINAGNSPVTSTITVSGFPFPEVGTGIIESVCIDVTHLWVGDLDIYLIAPDGKFLELTTDNGGSGDHYTNTCFTPTATIPIQGLGAAATPFTGNFQPEGPWNFLYGAPTNGDWVLQLTDDTNGFGGTLNSWSITFAPTYNINYSWSPSSGLSCTDCPAPTATPSITTTYTITADDTYGCVATDTVIIFPTDQLPAPVVTCGTPTSTTATFNWTAIPSSTGYEVNVNGTGWISPNGTLSHTITGLPANTPVSIEVRGIGSPNCPNPPAIASQTCSSVGCSVSGQIDSIFATSCFGDLDGRAYISAPTGIAPFTFSINGGSTTQPNGNFTGLSSGNYTTLITDSDGCSATLPFTVPQPAALNGTFSSTAVSCNGNNDGSLSIVVTGGTPIAIGTYNYNWNTTPSQTTDMLTGLSAGTYTVTVTDANGCTSTFNGTVTEPAVVDLTITKINVDCNGNDNGSATVIPTGGTPSYTYTWLHNGSLTSATASNLSPGTYHATVTDVNNCFDTDSVIITEPEILVLSMTSVDVSCNSAMDGIGIPMVNGGTTNYSYQWNTTPVQTDSLATGLSGGSYIVTVTDANNCTISDSVTLNEKTAIVATSSSTNISCNGVADGTISINATGGAGNYTYSWSHDPTATDSSLTGLAANTYVVTITDADNCFITTTFTLTQPLALSLNLQSNNISCNGLVDGTTDAIVTGGTYPYTYNWTFDGNPIATTDSNLTGLSMGTYAVTVTDANNCTTFATTTVIEPALLTLATNSTDATCSGTADGTATVVANGGTITNTYTYLWNSMPPQNTSTVIGLTAGTYTVTVTDDNGCADTASTSIVVPNPIILTSSTTDASCPGVADGTATVSAVGGTGIGTYTYSWNTSPTQTTATATGLAEGVYNVTVTDANGCFDTLNVRVNAIVVIFPSLTMTPVSCFGGNNGTATATATGGSPIGIGTYDFIWNNGQSTTTATNLTTGTYIVTVTDAIGCFGIDSIVVTEPTALVSTEDTTPLLCFEDGTGTATVTVNGGTPTYTYAWSTIPSQTTATANNLMAGTYFVTTTDNNNCTILDTIVVGQPDSITLILTPTQVSCHGAGDGRVHAVVTGGIPTAIGTYSYLWSNGQTTDTILNLSGGNYSVTVTDANNCIKSTNIDVLERPDIALSISTTPARCYNAPQGTATVMATGGIPTATGTYAYNWNTTPPQNTATANNLVAGASNIYQVTVTDTDGCTDTISTTINQPDSMTLSLSKVDISCFGAHDGRVEVAATGGVPTAMGTYTFEWNTMPPQTTALVTGVSAGTYIVTVTDANSCIKIDSIAVTEPLAITYTTTSTRLSCNSDFSGTATVMATGGVGTLSYAWNTFPVQTTTTAVGLAAGTYQFTVTDTTNCSITDTVTVTEPDVLSTTISSTAVICNGGNNGTATVVPSGGTTPYNFNWSTNSPNINPTAADLAGGLYHVSITDANNCFTIDSIEVEEPTALVATLNQTDVSCFGGNDGTADVDVIGGIPPYNYQWTPTNATTDSISNLIAGLYSVTVTDATNCPITASIQVNQPADIVLALSATSVQCSGDTNGTATVNAVGGTSPYHYAWNTIPTQDTATAIGLSPGWHTVTVTDANNCFKIDSVEVTAPNPLIITLDTTHVDCFGATTGIASVTAVGGVPNYNYNWNNGMSSASINVEAGDYTVTVTDQNGCSLVGDYTITQPAAPLVISTTANEINCFGGSDGNATVIATGGTPNYTYEWNTFPIQTTAQATNLTTGLYTVLVQDDNGCSTMDSIEVEQPAAITLILTDQQSTSCFGGDDGQATIAASGGKPDYTYIWNTIPPQMGTTATNLTGGETYSVSVTDQNGCLALENWTVTQPEPIGLTTNQTNITCNGLADGTATVLATGGTPAYNYLWSADNQTTVTAVNLTAGSYTVTVTDTMGCTAVTKVSLSEPPALFASTSTTPVSCKGSATGTATALVAGGIAPYYVIWDANANHQESSEATNLRAGTYHFTMNDANGCSKTDSVVVTEPTMGLMATVETINPTCFNDRDGAISVTTNGGTAPYQYSLDGQNFENSGNLVGLSAGTYPIIVRDDEGCTTTATAFLLNPRELEVNVISDQEIDFGNIVDLGAIAAGGVPPYDFQWTPSNLLSCPTCQFPSVNGLLVDTDFTVHVTDSFGCETQGEVTVRVNTPRRVFVANAFTPNDDGVNDVLFVQGGLGTTKIITFQIYDRWGELVHKVNDVSINEATFGWDGTFNGKKSASGVYAWFAEIQFIDGESILYKGSTTLLR